MWPYFKEAFNAQVEEKVPAPSARPKLLTRNSDGKYAPSSQSKPVESNANPQHRQKQTSKQPESPIPYPFDQPPPSPRQISKGPSPSSVPSPIMPNSTTASNSTGSVMQLGNKKRFSRPEPSSEIASPQTGGWGTLHTSAETKMYNPAYVNSQRPPSVNPRNVMESASVSASVRESEGTLERDIAPNNVQRNWSSQQPPPNANPAVLTQFPEPNSGPSVLVASPANHYAPPLQFSEVLNANRKVSSYSYSPVPLQQEVEVIEDAEVTRNKEALANTLTGDVINYYTKEMKRVLAKEIHPPNGLNEIHGQLVGSLVEAFTPAFKFTTGPNYRNKIDKLKASLTTKFEVYLRENNEKLQRKQEGLTRSLQKSKSSYVRKIEEIIKQHPSGMNENELKRKQNEIAMKERKSLELDIKQSVGEDEPLREHVRAFNAYVEEYWECVRAMNKLNLKKGKLREGQEPPMIPAEAPESREADNAQEGTLRSSSSRAMKEIFVSRETDTENIEDGNTASVEESPTYRQLLLNRCNEVKGQLEAGTVFKFKSNVVKEMFAKKIKEALHIAQDLNSTHKQIEDQMETIVTWSTKYIK